MGKWWRLFLFATICFSFSAVQAGPHEKRKAREKQKMEEIRKMVEIQELRFEAQIAKPMSGGNINLTSEYTLDIKNDTIEAFLPFFGRAYTAEYGSTEGGIKFREKARASAWKSDKKGYTVHLEVKAPKDTYKLTLSFSQIGFANLNVTCNNRQPISFSGIIIQPVKR